MNAWRSTRLRLIAVLLGVFVLLFPIGSRAASDEDREFRWDIINLDFAAGTVSPGGVASALANDGSKLLSLVLVHSSEERMRAAEGPGRPSA